MKKKSIKILSLLLTLVLLIGVLPGMSLVAYADGTGVTPTYDVVVVDVSFSDTKTWSNTTLPLTKTGNDVLGWFLYPASCTSITLESGSNVTIDGTSFTVTGVGESNIGIAYEHGGPCYRTFTIKAIKNIATVTYTPGPEATGEDQTVTVTKDEQGKLTHNIQKYEKDFTAPAGKRFDHWQGSDGNTYKYGDIITLTDDLILTAIWVDNSQDSGTQPQRRGGGLSGDLVFGFPGVDNSWEYIGGGMPQRAYRLSFAPMQGGSAYFMLTSGENGETMNVYPQTSVRVVPTPAPGYRLASIVWSMIDGSASYDITESQTFVMPAMDAVVYVTFQPIA